MAEIHKSFSVAVAANVVGGVAVAAVVGVLGLNAISKTTSPTPASSTPASTAPSVDSSATTPTVAVSQAVSTADSTVAAAAATQDATAAAPIPEDSHLEQLQANSNAYLWQWNGSSMTGGEQIAPGSTVQIIGPWASDADYVEVWEVDSNGDQTKRGIALRSTLETPDPHMAAAQQAEADDVRRMSPSPAPRGFVRPINGRETAGLFRPRFAYLGTPFLAPRQAGANAYRPNVGFHASVSHSSRR